MFKIPFDLLAGLGGTIYPLSVRRALPPLDIDIGFRSTQQAGPGRVTVFTHHNYINDPRRKWYGLGGRRP